jgi:hypothetical protein
MKKISLDLNQLTVETFAIERDGETEQGTVRAYSGVPLGGCVTIDYGTGCAPINPTYGTGEMYCICENLDEQVTRSVGCIE